MPAHLHQSNQGHRGCKPVDAIYEVECIDDSQRDHHGNGNGENTEFQDAGSERIADILQVESAAASWRARQGSGPPASPKSLCCDDHR